MLVPVGSFYGLALLCADQVIGSVRDLLFDDETWTIQYFVVETGAWPSPRRVVLRPADLENVDNSRRQISTCLTSSEVQASDPACAHPPVSQQEAIRLAGPPTVPLHWAGENPVEVTIKNDTHLQSTQEITGYAAETDARRVGRVRGFTVSIPEQSGLWGLEAILIRMGHSCIGKCHAVPVSEAQGICWSTRTVRIGASPPIADE